MNHETIKAVAELISSVAWPLIVFYILFSQKNTLSSVLLNLESLTLPGGIKAKMKLKRKLEKATESVLEEKSKTNEEVTERQLIAAESVQRESIDSDTSIIKEQMDDIAREYERVRASMQSSHERTRRMEVVMTKMRTLGLAAAFLLKELHSSNSPGSRLAAIAILQMMPNMDYVEWLAERLKIEQPFVAYHAAVALEVASRLVEQHSQEYFLSNVKKAKKNLGEKNRNSDRWDVLDRAEKFVLDQQ